jgi:putative SOS response-associated peptidase YedK
MPVILHAADHDAWLHAPPEEAIQLVAKYPAERLAVERTGIPWFSRKPPATEAPALL